MWVEVDHNFVVREVCYILHMVQVVGSFRHNRHIRLWVVGRFLHYHHSMLGDVDHKVEVKVLHKVHNLYNWADKVEVTKI